MNIQKNVVLAPFTTFGIGGPVDFFASAHSKHELVEALEYAKRNNLNYFILGSGANILIGDKGFRGFVIKNDATDVKISEGKDVLLTSESGAVIKNIINKTSEKGFSGFEHFAGIPSTVGGALWQNLHFLSEDRTKTVFIGEIVVEAEVFSESGKIQKVDKEYFKFGYDESILHHSKDVVLSATFTLKKEDPQVIKKRISENLKWREEKHPDYAWRISAGSVFKKIEGYGAGRLIEKVGLKGYSIGGAQISPKHANFIVNKGNATAKDVRALINYTQEKVKKDLGLDLITEISFIGEF